MLIHRICLCILLSLSLIATQLYASANPIPPIALKYNDQTGEYTAPIFLGHPAQEVDVLIDTGSSNLVVLGSKILCPNCPKEALTQDSFSPYRYTHINEPFLEQILLHSVDDSATPLVLRGTVGLAPSLQLLYLFDIHVTGKWHAHYESSIASVLMYDSVVGILPSLQIPYALGIYRKGVSLSSVMGMAYPAVSAKLPHNQKPQVYFDNLRRAFKLDDVFSLLYCDSRGQSYLYLGKPPSEFQQPQTLYTPIIEKSYYVTQLTGIRSQSSGQEFLSHSELKGVKTIIDSGTEGLIVLPKDIATRLVDFISAQASKANPVLSNDFWIENDCVPTDAVNIASFPTIELGFAAWNNPGKTIWLELPPQRYINSGGCGKGWVRLAFVAAPSSGQPPFIVVGSPLLENYAATFYRGKEARIGFTPSERLCQNN